MNEQQMREHLNRNLAEGDVCPHCGKEYAVTYQLIKHRAFQRELVLYDCRNPQCDGFMMTSASRIEAQEAQPCS